MVKNLLTLLSARQTRILSGAAVLMLTVFVSKILGLIRDRLLVHTFKPDEVATFLAAFRLPDLIFQLMIFGALSIAFIPIFTDFLQKKGEKEALEFATDVLNIFLIGFSAICLLVFIFAQPLMNIVVPGFTEDQKQVTASITQLILLGEILLAIGALFSSVAQSFQRFIIPAIAGITYNLGIIFGIISLAPKIGIYGPAAGVIIGAAMYALIQFPLIHMLGFRYAFRFNIFSSGIREVFSLMSMRTIGLAVEQINETIGIILASVVSTASVTYLTFAQHLQTVPIGLFGATMAQAALPILSREQSRGEVESFKVTLLTTMHQILFLTLPATAILIILRIPAVRLIFGASQFDWEATVLTGRTVAFLAIGLTAQSIILLLVRSFYAFKDTKTPVIVSLITVAINVILSVFFITFLHLEVWSLGISYAISANLALFLLLYFLNRKLGGFTKNQLISPIIKMLFAAILAAVALYLPIKALDQLVIDTTRTINLILLTGIASTFGLTVYFLLVWALKVKEVETFGNFIKKIYRMEFQVKSSEVMKETGAV